MALTIEAIDEQTIPILTKDYELEIDIGGAPDRAYVDGDMEGFYHEWDATSSKIKIKSEKVTRLISGALWKVHLVKGTKKLDSQITYNVVPSAPVITDPGRQQLYKGYPFSLDIDIANKPTIARGSGLLSGLKYGPRGDGADGLNIAGGLPADTNLTEAAFNAAIYAENNGGADNLAVPFDIKELGFYGLKISPTGFHQMELNAAGDGVVSVASATLSLTLGICNLAADTDYLYITRNVNVLYRVSRTFTNGGTLNLGSPFFSTSGVVRFRGVDLDKSHIYLVDVRTNSTYKGIRVLNKSDGTANRSFTLPTGVDNPFGIALHGDSLVVLDDTDNALYWCDKNTLAGRRASITKTIHLPSRNYRDISSISNTIFITDRSNHQIHEIDADSDDGTTITTFDVSYNVPSALRELVAIAVA